MYNQGYKWTDEPSSGGKNVENRRSLKQYRMVDLTLFAVLLAVFESIIILASKRWFPGEPWTVSLTPAITAIVLIRWGPWAGIHAALGGLVLCIGSGAQPAQFVIYLVGNLFSLLVVPFLRFPGMKEKITSDALRTLGFGLAVLLLMQVGRGLVSLCFGHGWEKALGFVTTEAVTDLFTLVILWIVRRLDGLLEDQRHYFRRIREEVRNP